MNSDSEQIAPSTDAAPASGRGAIGWALAVTMALVWYAFWGFWLSPAEKASKAGASVAPSVSFLPAPGHDAVAAEMRAIWSPTIFSLPSESGFSRGALTNGIGGRPPLQVRGSDSLFLDPPRGEAAKSGFRYAPDLKESVREALTNLSDRLPDTYVFGLAASTGIGVQVKLSSGLERKHLRTMDVPPDDILLKDKAWDASAFVEFNKEGKVSGVFLETKSSFEDVDALLIHALWRWQIEDAREPLSGRVTFRSPGRPQVAAGPQSTVGP